MNDVLIARYSSDTRQVETVRPWVQDPEDLQVPETITIAQEYEATHQKTLQDIRQLFNQSSDRHVYQIKFGCELYDDGSTGGYTEFGLNGNEIIFFDKDVLMYIPATREAQIIAQSWNCDRSNVLAQENLMERDCINRIKSYMYHGKHDLEKQVLPQVKVSRRQSHNNTQLYCQVYGFYPRAVDVKWMRNGTDEVLSDKANQILPHPDGTYQITVTVEVPAGEENRFSCHVDHISLEEMLSVRWVEAKNSRWRFPIYIGISLVTAMVVFIMKILRKSLRCKDVTMNLQNIENYFITFSTN
ncbi:major histocompatibility complex class I-related gene protein-like [Pseudophryne corroboree]|uniref:major histocompatibility complex class I-related gene protein-like n=1 Tax=Pseudophryne corroboree TaxID=495146 RepID=UPI003081A10D